jgi:hypothetical protein
MVRITGNPQAVEKNRKFPGYRHDGSFLAVFPAPFEHSSAPAFKVTVRAKTSQKILSTLNQQRAELFVAGLADPELLLDRAGLVATWCQTEICRYVSGMSEPAGVSDSEHVLKCCDRSHAANLTKSDSSLDSDFVPCSQSPCPVNRFAC